MSEDMKYSAIIFGSTGDCGQWIFKFLMESKNCSKICIVNRRNVEKEKKFEGLNLKEEKLEMVEWKNFDDFLLFEEKDWSKKSQEEKKKIVSQETLKVFGDNKYDVCFSCLGNARRNAPSKENYIAVNQKYPINLARICKLTGIEAHYHISTMGANANASNLYFKMKGTVENALKEMNFKNLLILQPGLLVKKSTTKSFFHKTLDATSNLFSKKVFSNTTQTVGKYLFEHWEKVFSNSQENGNMVKDRDDIEKMNL